MQTNFTNPNLQKGEGVLDNQLRPQEIEQYIGQTKNVKRLNMALSSAKIRNVAMDHTLLHGSAGLGKTSLAVLIARSMGTTMHATSGPSLERTADVLGLLTGLGEGDVLFIDEIHRISPTIEEYLYPSMEDYRVDFLVDKGLNAKTVSISLPKFTLVGATTRAGSLSRPLRDRFGLSLHMDFYPVEDLAKIVTRSAAILKVRLAPGEAEAIAQRSRGTPRIANRLLARVRDYMVAGEWQNPDEVLQAAFNLEGVDEHGIDDLDRRYLRVIREHYKGGPVGIGAIAAAMNESIDTLQDMVEPFLLYRGIIGRTPRGRKIL